METKSTTRVLTLMDSVGLSQVKFAEKCGIRPSNFNRALKSEKGISSQYLLRIAHAFNVNFEWLRNGIGEMFAEEKAIGKAQFAAFNQMLDANSSPVSQNVISGDNYQGTQTINATEGKIAALEQKIEAQTQLLAEKDKLIARQEQEIEFLRGLVSKQQ
ncbi:helix-turn-helix domain-containing protein [Leyella stercorea]|uniref:helix-turn-helix domain-containing protein n=1 Tax=Leyella stercorea TaxID=363265 RepID=UPI003A910497